MRIGLLLSSPSPHQVELIDAIGARSDVEAFVGYVKSHNPSRNWGRPTPDLHWENLPCSPRQILSGSLNRWLDRQQADIWLLSSAYTSPATHALATTLRRRRSSFAFLGEPPRPRPGFKGWLQQKLMMAILNRADAIVGTGTEPARRYRTLTGDQKPVASVPYYVDLAAELARPLVTCPSAQEPFRFVASSQLIHRKGLDVLIRACDRLPAEGWTLDIYGDGPLRKTLEESCLHRSSQIRFQGLLPYERRDEVFEGKHCFVFSTRWDGWGMVLPEALAMGLPVISTDQAMSAHEFIRHGENGQIGPANDESYLATAMREAMDSRTELGMRSLAAKESLKGYSPQIGAERLVQFLKGVSQKAA